MKLMKHITIALVLCAIPAMAFAQTAGCEDCDHMVSVYHGAGGLIATADGADMVNYRATCDNVTRTGSLTPDDDGVVSMLLTGDLACMEEDGSFELGPIMDGGWFWIHVGDNSAVGNLVAKDVLDNDPATITDAGDSITTMEGDGAVLLVHAETGRVGILPTILPEPPADDATRCGAFRVNATTVSQTTSGCMLGDGSTMVRILYDGTFGRTDHAVGSVTVYRNTTASGSVELDLWTTGGIVSTGALTDTPAGTGYIGLGNGLSLTTGGSGVEATVGGFGATLLAALGSGNETPEVTAGDEDPTADPNDSDHVTITFEGANASGYCTATSSNDAVLTVKLVSDQENVLPGVKNLGTATAMYHGTAMVTIKCPPPVANMGTELVPDNPFPTPIG